MWSFIEGVDFFVIEPGATAHLPKVIMMYSLLRQIGGNKSAVYRDLGVNEKPSDITSQTI